MGQLHYFLGIQVQQHQHGLFMSQQKYAEDLLVAASMADCTPLPTPLPVQLDRISNQEELFSDPTYFRNIAGKLQYLTLTRPDIQFAVNFVCQKMHQPTMYDFNLLKRILRYIKGTITMGVSYTRESPTVLHTYSDSDADEHSQTDLLTYSDSDWGNCKVTRRSVGGLCAFMGTNLISWSSKKQPTVSRSSTEAEYRSLTDAASEILWLSSVFRELGIPLPNTPELYCDNLSVVYLTANPAFHARTKHFDIDYHFVKERVALKALVVKHIPGHDNIADIFTKSLLYEAFSRLRSKLGVSLPPTPSLRGSINTIQVRAEAFSGKRQYVVVSANGAKRKMKQMGLAQTKPKKQKWRQRSSVSSKQSLESSSSNDKSGAGNKETTTSCTAKQFNVKLENRFSTLDSEDST